jgi:hypothetical protein
LSPAQDHAGTRGRRATRRETAGFPAYSREFTAEGLLPRDRAISRRLRTTIAKAAGGKLSSSSLGDQVLALATCGTQQKSPLHAKEARSNHVGAAIARGDAGIAPLLDFADAPPGHTECNPPASDPSNIRAKVKLRLGKRSRLNAALRTTPAGLVSAGIMTAAIFLSIAALVRTARRRY